MAFLGPSTPPPENQKFPKFRFFRILCQKKFLQLNRNVFKVIGVKLRLVRTLTKFSNLQISKFFGNFQLFKNAFEVW